MNNRQQTNTFKIRRATAILIAGCFIATALSGCSSMGRIERHGHILTAEDLDNVKTGMGKDQILLALGTPDTTSSMGGSVFYYMSHKTNTISLLKPATIDRKIVAVYFNKNDTVIKLANYGLKDGRLFDYVSRKTPSHGGDYTFLQQMFGNLGKGTPQF